MKMMGREGDVRLFPSMRDARPPEHSAILAAVEEV